MTANQGLVMYLLWTKLPSKTFFSILQNYCTNPLTDICINGPNCLQKGYGFQYEGI